LRGKIARAFIDFDFDGAGERETGADIIETVRAENKDAFIAASKPVYEEYAKEVKGAREVIDRAIALGK